MNEAEEILGIAELYRQRDQAIPVDILARAEQLGLHLPEHVSDTTEPQNTNCQQGDN